MQIINLLKNHGIAFREESLFKRMRDLSGFDNKQSKLRHLFFQEIIIKMGRLWRCLEHSGNTFTPCFFEYRGHPEQDALMHLLEQIPIFLVDENSIGKSFRIGFIGKSLDITVPEDKYRDEEINIKDLLEEVEDGICVEVECEKEMSPQPDFLERKYNKTGEPMDAYVVNDLLGVYVRTYPANRVYDMTESHPQIFIWIDKIWKISESSDSEKMALLAQVITHEFMHAFMDIDLLGIDRVRNFRIKPKLYQLKEECLANALSWNLVEPHLNWKQRDFVCDFIKSQSFAYRLGYEYEQSTVFIDKELVETAFFSWMEIKKQGKANKDVLKYWLRYLPYCQRERFPKEVLPQLCLYEEGLVNPERVFRYQSKMYFCGELAVKVIKDYYANKMIQGGVSRQDMKDAFPDMLNNEYNVFIDYPELTEFRKKDSSWSTSAKEENIIVCQDGKLAICKDWRYDSKPSFVDYARKLGFEIEIFGN
jgi:hypothetical protein